MRDKITSEILLINYLFYHPEASLDVLKLTRIKEGIFKHTKGVYVDIKDDSIVAAVESNWFLFNWDPKNTDNVIRAKDSENFTKKQVDAFNYGLPEDVVSALEKACKENY